MPDNQHRYNQCEKFLRLKGYTLSMIRSGEWDIRGNHLSHRVFSLEELEQFVRDNGFSENAAEEQGREATQFHEASLSQATEVSRDSTHNTPTVTRATPPMNIYERDDRFCVEILMPGLNIHDINIKIQTNLLMVKSQRKVENFKEHGHYKVHVQDILSESFSCSVHLPKYIDINSVVSEYEKGILIVIFSKNAVTPIDTDDTGKTAHTAIERFLID